MDYDAVNIKNCFKNGEKFITGKKLLDVFGKKYVVDIVEGTSYKSIYPQEYNDDDDFSIICKNEDYEELNEKYVNTEKCKNTWEKVAEVAFKNTLKVLQEKLNEIFIEYPRLPSDTNSAIVVMQLHEYTELKNKLYSTFKKLKENNYITEIFITPNPNLLFILKENLLCVAYIGKKHRSKQYEICLEQYFALCKYDCFEVECGEKEKFSFDITTSPTHRKENSIIKNGIIGSIIGGQTGAIIGVAKAINDNIKRNYVEDSKPITINMNLESLDLWIYSNLMQKKQKYVIQISYMEKGTKIETLIEKIQKGQSIESRLNGELLKEFVLQLDESNSYSEEEFQKYASRRKMELLIKLSEKQNSISENIVLLKKEIQKLYDKNSKDYLDSTENIKLKYDSSIIQNNKEIDELYKKKKSCNLFQIKSKIELTDKTKKIKLKNEENEIKKQKELNKAYELFKYNETDISKKKCELEMVLLEMMILGENGLLY